MCVCSSLMLLKVRDRQQGGYNLCDKVRFRIQNSDDGSNEPLNAELKLHNFPRPNE